MWGSAPACVERGLCDEHGPCSLAPGKQLPLGLGSRVSTSEGGTGVSEANTSGFVDTVGSSHTGFSPRQHDGAGSGEPLGPGGFSDCCSPWAQIPPNWGPSHHLLTGWGCRTEPLGCAGLLGPEDPGGLSPPAHEAAAALGWAAAIWQVNDDQGRSKSLLRLWRGESALVEATVPGQTHSWVWRQGLQISKGKTEILVFPRDQTGLCISM